MSEYHNEAKEDLYVVATCKCGHKKCRKQRTLLPRKTASGSLAQGRPIGYLVAWLQAGSRVGVTCGKDHKKAKVTLEQRQQAREQFKLLADAQLLLDDEREQRPGEPEEPPREP